MKKLIFLIPLLLLIQPAFGEMIVENDQTYIGNDGIMHIVGEIKNESKSPVNKIKIIATLTDENGKVVDTFARGEVLAVWPLIFIVKAFFPYRFDTCFFSILIKVISSFIS